MPNGGKRPGAGRKPGYVAKEAELANEEYVRAVRKRWPELVHAQIELALKPDAKMLEYIMNRVLGRPKESLALTDPNGNALVINWQQQSKSPTRRESGQGNSTTQPSAGSSSSSTDAPEKPRPFLTISSETASGHPTRNTPTSDQPTSNPNA